MNKQERQKQFTLVADKVINEMKETKYIIVHGNVINGLQFTGPFSAPDSALEWAEKELDNKQVDWHLAEIDEAEGDFARDSAEIDISQSNLPDNWDAMLGEGRN